jgi:hypothetical protein
MDEWLLKAGINTISVRYNYEVRLPSIFIYNRIKIRLC